MKYAMFGLNMMTCVLSCSGYVLTLSVAVVLVYAWHCDEVHCNDGVQRMWRCTELT